MALTPASGSSPLRAGIVLTMNGSRTCVRLCSTASTTLSAIWSGVSHGVSKGAVAPSNIPVDTYPGHTAVTCTCRCPSSTSSAWIDSEKPRVAHLLAA